MKQSGTFFVILFLVSAWFCKAQDQGNKPWEAVLAKHVNERGNVNYNALKKDLAGLDAYLDYLALHPPSQDSRRVDSLAYFINLYNAATLRLVAEHYPLKSIQDIENPWDRKFIRSGEKRLSLQQVEHDILRKLNDPRIHFAINCASISCPPLLNVPYRANDLDQQLEKVTRNFINNPRYNALNSKPPRVSRIFDWYKEDFGGKDGVVAFIHTYHTGGFNPQTPLQYLEYDWQLNAQQ